MFCRHLSDEDLKGPGDHLLAETSQPLSRLIQYQGQKKIHLQLDRPNLKAIGATSGPDCSPFGLILASNVGRLELSLAFYAKSGTFKGPPTHVTSTTFWESRIGIQLHCTFNCYIPTSQVLCTWQLFEAYLEMNVQSRWKYNWGIMKANLMHESAFHSAPG